jgi:hypothetical protein
LLFAQLDDNHAVNNNKTSRKPQKPGSTLIMVASELTASARAMRSTPVSSDESGSSLPKPLSPLQNRAAASRSPYIREHAEDLVAWQLLDDEAVERSRKENKLIFLHIGYKACHCKSRDHHFVSFALPPDS